MRKMMKASLLLVLAGFVLNSYSAVVTNWVADAGFEGLSLWSAPNPDTSPWFSTRETKTADYGFVARELTLVNSGDQAMKYSTWGDAQANQWLGLTVDSNAIYEVRFFMRLDNKSTNASQTNETNIGVLVSTGSVPGTNATWKITTYGIVPSTTNIWEEQVVHFYGSDMADRQGEYILLGLRKWNKSSEYVAYIDDVSFGEYIPDPTPGNLLVGWDSTSGAPDYSTAGVTGTLFNGSAFALNTVNGSSDETFGSTNSGATVARNCYEVRIANSPDNDHVAVQIQNKTGAPLQLDSLSFDYSRWSADAPSTVDIIYSYGNLSDTNGTPIATFTGIAETDRKGDYTDFDVPLTNLVDRVLGAGEKATFRLTVSDAAGQWYSGGFDNIAIFGGPITATGYEGWAIGYSLVEPPTGDDDKDGLSNLYEYGLGGDPTDEFDQGTSPVFGVEDVGGTNYFGYVHPQLSDPASDITYSLALRADLTLGSWVTNAGYVITGTNVTGGDLDFVTNVTDTVDGQKFIKLIIE